MSALNEAARTALTAGRLAHLVTVNADGSPQASIVWIGLDGDEIVSAHLGKGRRIANIRRDPRVVLSVEAEGRTPSGLDHYILVRGTARLTEGGGPELLQKLAHVYLGPDVKFPNFDNPPPGIIVRIAVESVSGIGPWVDDQT